MKYLAILFFALAAVGCTKKDTGLPIYSVQNTSWTYVGTPVKHYSFTKDDLVITSPDDNSAPITLAYAAYHDTLLIYQQMAVYKVQLSRDSLLLCDVRTNQILRFYRY